MVDFTEVDNNSHRPPKLASQLTHLIKKSSGLDVHKE